MTKCKFYTMNGLKNSIHLRIIRLKIQYLVKYQKSLLLKIYIQFQFNDGNSYFTLYDEVIHLRRFFNGHDIYGNNNDVLKGAMQTANVANEGIQNAIKTSTALKGILKYGAMLKEKDVKATRDQFVEDFIKNTKDGSGIAGLDAKAEFQELNLKPLTLDKDQLNIYIAVVLLLDYIAKLSIIVFPVILFTISKDATNAYLTA